MKKIVILLLFLFIVIGVIGGVMFFLGTQKNTAIDTIELRNNVTPTGSSIAPTLAQTVTDVTNQVDTTISSHNEILLQLTSPQNNTHSTVSSIDIKGKTTPNASVFVNEFELAADKTGLFSQKVTLEEGDNYFVVVAADANGNSAEQELTVIYDVAE